MTQVTQTSCCVRSKFCTTELTFLRPAWLGSQPQTKAINAQRDIQDYKTHSLQLGALGRTEVSLILCVNLYLHVLEPIETMYQSFSKQNCISKPFPPPQVFHYLEHCSHFYLFLEFICQCLSRTLALMHFVQSGLPSTALRQERRSEKKKGSLEMQRAHKVTH